MRGMMNARATRWLKCAGVAVPRGKAVEICPTIALDAEELKQKLTPDTTLPDPVLFQDNEP